MEKDKLVRVVPHVDKFIKENKFYGFKWDEKITKLLYSTDDFVFKVKGGFKAVYDKIKQIDDLNPGLIKNIYINDLPKLNKKWD